MKNRKIIKISSSPVRPTYWNNNNNSSLPKWCDIRESLRPIVVLLKCFGLYHEVSEYNFCAVGPLPDVQSGATTDPLSPGPETGSTDVGKGRQTTVRPRLPERKICKWVCLATRCYSVVVLVVLSLITVKFALALRYTLEGPVTFKVVMMNWNLQNFLSTVCMFVSCCKKEHFRTFYKQWMELFCDPITRELKFEPTNCSKGIRIIVALGTAFCLVNVAAVMTCTLNEDIPVQDLLQHNLIDPLPVTKWTLAIFLITHVINTAAWTLPNTFVVCTSHILTVHFNRLTKTIQREIESSSGNIPHNIKDMRTRHLKLCEVLETFNLFMKWFLTVNFLATILGSCFILYDIIFKALDAFSYALYVFWVLINVLTAFFLSISLSRTHEAAHGPLEALFKLETDNANLSQVIQVQLFLAKLTGTSIGATVLDLFVVNKESLLTIASAYITYFLLVVQYNF